MLHIAASTGRLDIYKKLLKFSHERNPRAEDGRTPLHHACKNGHLNIVEFLLPNLMDKSPRTILGNYILTNSGISYIGSSTCQLSI